MIDGVLDPGLRMRTLVPIGWQSNEQPLPPMPDVPVQVSIAYRPNGLYFFLDISDPNRFPALMQEVAYCGDSVELYIDHDGVLDVAPDYDPIGALQFIGRAPVDETTPRSDGEVYLPTTLLHAWQTGFVATPRPGGYTLEAFIDATAMGLGSWSLASGSHVGIDLALGLSTADGSLVPLVECPQSTRLGQFFLQVDESMLQVYGRGAPYKTSTALCFPALQ